MAGKAARGGAPSGGVTGMSVIANADTMRAAIARDGGLCVTCGRPCKNRRGPAAHRGRQGARRPDELGGHVPRPARRRWPAGCRRRRGFVYHVHDTTLVARAALPHRAHEPGLPITILSWLGFAAVFGYLLALGAQGLGWHLMATASAASAALLGAGSSWRPGAGQTMAEQRVIKRQRPQTLS